MDATVAACVAVGVPDMIYMSYRGIDPLTLLAVLPHLSTDL